MPGQSPPRGPGNPGDPGKGARSLPRSCAAAPGKFPLSSQHHCARGVRRAAGRNTPGPAGQTGNRKERDRPAPLYPGACPTQREGLAGDTGQEDWVPPTPGPGSPRLQTAMPHLSDSATGRSGWTYWTSKHRLSVSYWTCARGHYLFLPLNSYPPTSGFLLPASKKNKYIFKKENR